MPRIMQVIMVKRRVRRRLFPPRVMIALAIVRPKPVLLTTPMMMPTQAQAIATGTVCLAPSMQASRMSRRLMRVDFLKAETITVTAMVITAE